MANIAQQCNNLNIFFNGVGWAGRVNSFQAPTLESTVEDYRAGGMDGAIPLRTGQEPMMAEFVFNGYQAEVIGSWGLADATAINTNVRGALTDYTGEETPIQFFMEGPVTMLELEPILGQGEVPKVTATQRLHYYRLALAGQDIVEIDFINMQRSILASVQDGVHAAGQVVDRLESIRGLLGL